MTEFQTEETERFDNEDERNTIPVCGYINTPEGWNLCCECAKNKDYAPYFIALATYNRDMFGEHLTPDELEGLSWANAHMNDIIESIRIDRSIKYGKMFDMWYSTVLHYDENFPVVFGYGNAFAAGIACGRHMERMRKKKSK